MKALLWALATIISSPFLVLSSRRRRRSDHDSVLIIQLGKVGDLLCTTPMFRAIKEAHPQTSVHVLCRRGSAIILVDNPYVDALHIYEAQPRWSLLRILRGERYRWTINCMPGAFASVIGLWALCPNRINTSSDAHGILVRWYRMFSRWNFPYLIRTRTFDHYMKLLSPMDIQPTDYRLDFPVSAGAKEKVDAWLAAHKLTDTPFIIVNLSAGNSVKEWPADKFAALIDRIQNELQLPIVLSTLDHERVKRVRSAAHRPESVFDGSNLSLGALGALCKHAAAHVSVDTGPLYVAFAMGTPLVIILGPISPAEQVPPESATIVHIPPPAGCEPWVFVSLTPRQGTEEQLRCARDTSVDAVFEGLKKVLGRK